MGPLSSVTQAESDLVAILAWVLRLSRRYYARLFCYPQERPVPSRGATNYSWCN